MARRIKLENINSKRKDHAHLTMPLIGPIECCPICGEDILEEALEDLYVCESCRHLIDESWAFCPYCKEPLEKSNLVEHYRRGVRIADQDFQSLKVNIKKEGE